MSLPTRGRNRPVNVGVSPFLLAFIRKLGWATSNEEAAARATEGNVIRPGSWNIGEGRGDHPYEVGVELLWDSLLSKFDDGLSSEAKTTACDTRFIEAETRCASTNSRFRTKDSFWDETKSLSFGSVLALARNKISYLLGAYDSDEHMARCNFSGGASTRLPRRFGKPAFKYSGIPETTFDNLSFAARCVQQAGSEEDPIPNLWLQGTGGAFTLRQGNRLESVPKNYKTDRAIAIEPDMNMYVQKGLGAMIRTRLRKVAIDLNDQSVNQRGAYIGSLDGSLATVDLSMASDTISYEVVKALLPWDWFEALLACRSEQGSSPSLGVITYEKFSSMGNGATFELESLIFWALCSAACDVHGSDSRLVKVYGDDLVIPTRSAQYCCDILHAAGFRVNDSKSHFSGLYRESCGKHYFSGADVTPFFVKKEDSTLAGLFKLHNQLYRWMYRTSHSREQYDRLRAVLNWLRTRAPQTWQRPRIPDGYGDGAFIGSFDEACPTAVRPCLHGWEGWRVRVLVERTVAPLKRKKSPSKGAYIVSTSLRLSYEGLLSSLLSLDADMSKPVFRRISTPWGGLSQVTRYQVQQILVVHFP